MHCLSKPLIIHSQKSLNHLILMPNFLFFSHKIQQFQSSSPNLNDLSDLKQSNQNIFIEYLMFQISEYIKSLSFLDLINLDHTTIIYHLEDSRCLLFLSTKQKVNGYLKQLDGLIDQWRPQNCAQKGTFIFYMIVNLTFIAIFYSEKHYLRILPNKIINGNLKVYLMLQVYGL